MRRARTPFGCWFLALLAPCLGACVSFPGPGPDPEATIEPEPLFRPEPEELFPARPGTEIVVCGQRFEVGAPVVLWFEDPRYDGYAEGPRFLPEGPRGLRYRPGREPRDAEQSALVRRSGWTLETLRRQVDLFVLHYDVCGTSRTCFKVLHDVRQLSVHFLLDVDGTIYQTLDLREQAWHASEWNPRSIGVEIAQIGAYPPTAAEPLEEWYREGRGGSELTLPQRFGDGGVRTPDYRGRPARPERLRGRIHGELYEQYDFTSEQYESLVKLTATLTRVFPRLAVDAPRGPGGRVRTDALPQPELEAYQGVLGHYHLTTRKRDPGPAFDWDRYLAAVDVALSR